MGSKILNTVLCKSWYLDENSTMMPVFKVIQCLEEVNKAESGFTSALGPVYCLLIWRPF